MKNNELSLSQIVAVNVRTIVKDRGMSLVKYERSIGFRPGYFSRIYTTGKGSISIDTVSKISETLNVTIDELINPDYLKTRKRKKLENKIAELRKELEGEIRKLQEEFEGESQEIPEEIIKYLQEE